MAPSRNFMESIADRLPQKRSDRVKLMVAVPILAICTIWLGYVMVSSMDWSGPTREPDSPAHRLVTELNAKLLEDVRFNDVGFAIESESPLKLKVVGAVHAAEYMPQLQQFLKEIRPEGDFEMDVVVLP